MCSRESVLINKILLVFRSKCWFCPIYQSA